MSTSVKVEAPLQDNPFQNQFVEVDCPSPGLLGDFSNVWKTLRTVEDCEEQDSNERLSVIHKAEEVTPIGSLGDFRNIWTFLQAIKDGNIEHHIERHKELLLPKTPAIISISKQTDGKARVPSSRKSAYTNAEPPKRVRSGLDEVAMRPRKLESSDTSDNGDRKASGLLKKHITTLRRSKPESEPPKETLRVKKDGKSTALLSPKPASENLKVKVKKTTPSSPKAKSSIKAISPVERLAQNASAPVERQAENGMRATFFQEYESVINKTRKATDATNSDGAIIKGKLKLYSVPDQKKKFVTLLSSQARKQTVLSSLLKNFPVDEPTLLSPYHPARSSSTPEPGIHVFIDNSNIIIGFYQALKRIFSLPENVPTQRPNFDFHAFSFILERGRRTSTKCLVGSFPSTPAIVEAEKLGYTINLLTRVEKQQPPATKPGSPKSAGKKSPTESAKKTEQAVDEIISLKMALTLLDNADCPSTLVLASGDAAQGEFSDGFRSVVERFLKAGWKVEVMSFKSCLGNGYREKEWGKRWGERFRVVELDGYVEAFLADEEVAGV